MGVGIISVFVDYQRRGGKKHGVLQPQVGPLIAGLLPLGTDIEIINDLWAWRRRGAKTVLGGTTASAYPRMCMPHFDAVVVGDAERRGRGRSPPATSGHGIPIRGRPTSRTSAA
jgi:hypothetical protein